MSARLLVAMGGSFQNIVSMPNIVSCDLVVYSDVSAEVDKMVRGDGGNSKIAPLVLGKGDTIPTLLAKRGERTKDMQNFFAKLPSIDLSRGMGAWPVLGREAIGVWIDGFDGDPGELDNFVVERVFNPVFQANSGTLSNMEIVALGSLSGGTGGGTGYMLPQQIFDVFSVRSNASLAMKRLSIGAITFNGLSRNILPNAGMRLLEYLSHLLAVNRHPREIRSLVLVELPPLGNNKETRDALTMQLTQAYFDPAFAHIVDIGDVAKFDTLDGIRVLNVKWWNHISPRLTAAFKYINDMDDLIKALRPDLNVCSDIRTEVLESGGVWTIATLRDYLQTYHKVPSPDEAQGNLSFDIRTFIVFSPNDEKPLMMHTLMKPVGIPKTLQEFQDVMQQYFGLRDRIKSRLDVANKDFAEANSKLQILIRQLDSLVASYSVAGTVVSEETQPKKKKPWWTRLWEWLTSKFKTKVTTVVGSGNLMQEFLDQLHLYCKCAAIVQALKSAWDIVVTNLDYYHDRFRRLEKALKDIKGDKGEEGLTYVGFKPFAELFPGMLELSEAGRIESLKSILDDSVKNVTQRGLGAVVGLGKDDSEIVKICSKILYGEPKFVSPGWGGEEMDDENLKIRVIVLPPMAEDLRSEVKETMERLKAEPEIVFGSTNCGGVNVVEIGVYRVNTINQIITPLYKNAIREALQNKEIYSLPDIDTADLRQKLQLEAAQT